jgi:hypothetical protein
MLSEVLCQSDKSVTAAGQTSMGDAEAGGRAVEVQESYEIIFTLF